MGRNSGYYEFRVERDGVISKAVRAYLQVGDEVKLVRVDRDTDRKSVV